MSDRLIQLNVEAATRAIQTRLHRASSAGDNWLLFDGGEWEKRICESYLLDAWLLLVDLIARLEHGPLLEFANDQYEKCKSDPSAAEMGPEEPYLIWLSRAYNLLHMIQELYLSGDPTVVAQRDIDHLISIVRNSEYFITSLAAFGWLPCREDDVHQRIEGLIKCTFPDVLTRPPLAKPIKGFVPDTGVPSVRTLIEYKFVQTEADGKLVLDQILADISGYQSDAYDAFVFVVYETARLFAESEWNAAIAASKPRWRVEVLTIRGVPPTADHIKFSDMLQQKRKSSKAAK